MSLTFLVPPRADLSPAGQSQVADSNASRLCLADFHLERTAVDAGGQQKRGLQNRLWSSADVRAIRFRPRLPLPTVDDSQRQVHQRGGPGLESGASRLGPVLHGRELKPSVRESGRIRLPEAGDLSTAKASVAVPLVAGSAFPSTLEDRRALSPHWDRPLSLARACS